MTVVKLPRKLQDILEIICQGEIERGLVQLKKFDGFEPQKAAALAEIAYFQHNFENAMEYDELALMHNHEWYSSNILHEHLFAYTWAAISSGDKIRAKNFFKKFLKHEKDRSMPQDEEEEKEIWDDKKKLFLEDLNFMLKEHGRRLDNKSLHEDMYEPSYVVKKELIKPGNFFIELLNKHRPKVSEDSKEAADYMLHFMYKYTNTKDFLVLYKKYAEDLFTTTHHINAAKIYVSTKQLEEARQAMRRMTLHGWIPIEHTQVAPMELFSHIDLLPLLTHKFCEELLHMKGQQWH
jgi:hypothetical protein